MGAYGSPELYPYNSDDNNNKNNSENKFVIIARFIVIVLISLMSLCIYLHSKNMNIIPEINIAANTTETPVKAELQTIENQNEQSSAEFNQNNSVQKTTGIGNGQAVKRANIYINTYGDEVVRVNLREVLTKEGFSRTEIDYALSNANINWNKQAVKRANIYINTYKDKIVRANLREVLNKEGFAETEVEYALNNIDWNEQAVKRANIYIELYNGSIDREKIKKYLTEIEGFAETEVEYALSQVGL